VKPSDLVSHLLEEEEPKPDQLAMGIEVEMEHTRDPRVAEKIARDHLAEDPDYYSKLKTCGIMGENTRYSFSTDVPLDGKGQPKTKFRRARKSEKSA
jgi:hypothetical protein